MSSTFSKNLEKFKLFLFFLNLNFIWVQEEIIQYPPAIRPVHISSHQISLSCPDITGLYLAWFIFNIYTNSVPFFFVCFYYLLFQLTDKIPTAVIGMVSI